MCPMSIYLIVLLLCSLASRLESTLDVYVEKKFKPSVLSGNNTPSPRRLSLDQQPIEPNPMFRSPFEGTDIISKPTKIVNCGKQTHCIIPALQLTKTFKVYYCKRVSYGIRFYYLIREGLTLHPKIVLVNTPEEAEVIVYLPESANWAKSECNKPEYFSKMVVLDESDGSHIQAKPNPAGGPWYVLYFKRSFVNRQAGRFRGYMNYLYQHADVFPMTYPIGEAYVQQQFSTIADRDFDVVCTLRDDFHDAARMRVRKWVNVYAKLQGLSKYQGGQINKASRTTVDGEYFAQMRRAKIVVTVNPAGWEGDFRFMEAVASGALIFVDHMYAPRPHPLLDGVHVVYYDNDNKTDLFVKLDFYRHNVKKARQVAISGYLHAMKHHRTVSLVDYVMRSVHVKLALQEEGNRQPTGEALNSSASVVAYSQTGFDMHSIARKFGEAYKKAGSTKMKLVQGDFEEKKWR